MAVQLPTFSFFRLGTTVSVPDRGSVYLGGVNRASSGSREARVPLAPGGPFRNRASGGGASASGMSASVYIHDFQAMDEALRGQPSGEETAARRKAPAGVGHSGTAVPRPLALSPAEAARQRPLVLVDSEQEAEDLYHLGVEAQSQGNPGAAKVFYEMASRRATGELRERVLARLREVSEASSAPSAAERR